MSLCVVPSCRTHADAEPGAQTCGACREHLTRQLGEIESYLSIVTPIPSRSGGFGPHRPGFASTPPLRLDVVAMLDPRTELNGFGPDDVLDEVPNIGEDLGGWWRVVCQERDEFSLPPNVLTQDAKLITTALRTSIGWICRQAWADGFAADIARVHGALARACGDTPAKPFARCPAVVAGAVCGGPVVMHADGAGSQCLTCRASWRRDQLLDLMASVNAVNPI